MQAHIVWHSQLEQGLLRAVVCNLQAETAIARHAFPYIKQRVGIVHLIGTHRWGGGAVVPLDPGHKRLKHESGAEGGAEARASFFSPALWQI